MRTNSHLIQVIIDKAYDKSGNNLFAHSGVQHALTI